LQVISNDINLGDTFYFYCNFLDLWNVGSPPAYYELIEYWEQFSEYFLVQLVTIKLTKYDILSQRLTLGTEDGNDF